VPIRRLTGIPVDLDDVHTMDDFEVIDILENTSPYPTLLGLDWAFDNQYIINLKTRKIILEYGEYIVLHHWIPTVEPIVCHMWNLRHIIFL
jgi:hypothetical protein